MCKCTGKYSFESVREVELSIMKGWTVMQTLSHGPFWTWNNFSELFHLKARGLSLCTTHAPVIACKQHHGEKWPWLGGSFQPKQFSANVSVYSTKPTTLQMKEWAFEYKRGSGLGITVSTMIFPWSIQAHFIELRELFPQDTGWTLSGKTAKSKIQRRSYHSYLKVVINTCHLSASLIGDCSNLG